MLRALLSKALHKKNRTSLSWRHAELLRGENNTSHKQPAPETIEWVYRRNQCRALRTIKIVEVHRDDMPNRHAAGTVLHTNSPLRKFWSGFIVEINAAHCVPSKLSLYIVHVLKGSMRDPWHKSSTSTTLWRWCPLSLVSSSKIRNAVQNPSRCTSPCPDGHSTVHYWNRALQNLYVAWQYPSTVQPQIQSTWHKCGQMSRPFHGTFFSAAWSTRHLDMPIRVHNSAPDRVPNRSTLRIE